MPDRLTLGVRRPAGAVLRLGLVVGPIRQRQLVRLLEVAAGLIELRLIHLAEYAVLALSARRINARLAVEHSHCVRCAARQTVCLLHLILVRLSLHLPKPF